MAIRISGEMVVKMWLSWLECPSWSREGFPLDFVTNRAFYTVPVFRPFLDEFLIERGFWSPPQYGKGKFAVVVTLDLDRFYLMREGWRRLYWACRKKELKLALSVINAYFLKRCLIGNFVGTDIDEYLQLFRDFGVKSTLFVPYYLGEWQDPRDPMYSLCDKVVFRGSKYKIVDMLQEFYKDGHGIGLHPSIGSFQDIEILAREKEGLERLIGIKIRAVRQHWLMFDPRVTPYLQSQSGFYYDSTFGFNRMPGFRGGTAYPFRFGRGSVLEIPLILQDGALLGVFTSGALGLTLSKAVSLTREIMERVARVGGVLVVLCHPFVRGSLNSRERLEWLRSVVIHARRLGASFMTMEEIGEYWEANYESALEDVFQGDFGPVFQKMRERGDVWSLWNNCK